MDYRGIVEAEKVDNLTISKENVNRKSQIPLFLERVTFWDRWKGIKNPKHSALALLLWYSGVRVTEALELRKKHIDFQNGVCRVLHQKSRKWYERLIPLHNELLVFLRAYTATLKADDKLFPFSRQQAFMVIKKHFLVSPHALRHSFAVNFIRQNKSPGGLKQLQNLLGHSNIGTTMIYLQALALDTQEALNEIKMGAP